MLDYPTMPKVRPFTPEEDAFIRACASAGYYARHCATALGRTRNSIIGRAHRLGVTFRRRNGIVPEKVTLA